jgi:hypothetical protein
MPTYDFRCTAGHVFEDMQPSAAPNPPCRVFLEGGSDTIPCSLPTEKVPSFRGNVIGNTPKFYPNRG